MITQAFVKNLFDYNPETGICTWRKYRLKAAPGDPIDERYVYRDGYITISAKGKTHRLHRLIWLWMTGRHPENQIDHLNGDKLDNRWKNLRDVTPRENNENREYRNKKNPSPTGVRRESTHSWVAKITINGTVMHLGRFDSEEKAQNAYLQAKTLFHGQTRFAQ